MVQRNPQKFSRLLITVPSRIAEAYGSALMELGAGAVEERATEQASTVELVLNLVETEPLEPWENLCRTLCQAFAEELELDATQFTLRAEACELDYHEGWLKHLSLVRITPQLVLAPEGCATETPAGTSLLRFVPNPCFGDGSHVTTRLASTAVEAFCEAQVGLRLLDVGTGNGVLSLVGAHHGAFAVGLDIDEEALDSARVNAKLNALDERCLFSSQAITELDERFALVVCNLETRTQLRLAAAIAPKVQPAGTLLLTGFLEEQVASIVEPYQALGFTLATQIADGDYALVTLLAPAPASAP